jgi:hypothetical protein
MLVQELIGFVSKNNINADKVLAELEVLAKGSKFEKPLLSISKELEYYNFDEALEQLNAMAESFA